MTDAPLVVLIAGPNGAGKSTNAPRLLEGALHVEEFVNADAIARGLSVLRPERAAMAAGRVMLAHLRSLVSERRSFAFETTLASRSFAPWLVRLRALGYRSHLVFFSLPTPELALARVAARVRSGGHDIPPEVVRRRFRSGLRNLLGLYAGVVDSWRVFDNSEVGSFHTVASGHLDGTVHVHDSETWRILMAWTT